MEAGRSWLGASPLVLLVVGLGVARRPPHQVASGALLASLGVAALLVWLTRRPGGPGPPRHPSRAWLTAAAVGLVFAATQLTVAWLLGPELVAMASSATSLAAALALCRWHHGPAQLTHHQRPGLLRALAPYLGLLPLVAAARLGRQPLATAPRTLELPWRPILSTLGESARRLGRTVWTLVCLTATAKVMAVSGMVTTLARRGAGGRGADSSGVSCLAAARRRAALFAAGRLDVVAGGGRRRDYREEPGAPRVWLRPYVAYTASGFRRASSSRARS